MHPALALGIAYVSGSIPFAYLAGRIVKGVDLRTVGSGNLGATNVYRHLGGGAALIVLLADAMKGALPAALLPSALDAPYRASVDATLWWGLAFGAAAIAGHAKPIFLLWKGGGKGVATAAGVFAALAPFAVLLAAVVFAMTVWRSGFVSLGSIGSALTLPLALALTVGVVSPLFLASCAVGAFVIWAHRANITRLRQGTEPRIHARGSEDAT